MRIGIICSEPFIKFSDIRKIIRRIYEDIGPTNCIILSAAHSLGDNHVKMEAIKHELTYLEYNPAYTGKNMFSAETHSYYANKNWHYSQIMHRYQRLFQAADKLFIFRKINDSDKTIDSAIKFIPKKLKHSIIYT